MIQCRNIDVTFNEGTPLEMRALRNVSLEIKSGEFVTAIGSNGAGKSTMLNVLAGVVRSRSGRVEIDDTDLTGLPPAKRASLVSRVFQDPKMGTCEDLTIMENVALAYARTSPRNLRSATTQQMRSEMQDRIAKLGLGLENRLDDRVGLLSGGQRQAVSLLMATTGTTRALLLDEHTAALDPKTAEFVLQLTAETVEQLRLTTLMVTHSMAQALEYGTRTIMFHRGRVVFDVSGEERKAMTVGDLLKLFRTTQQEELADDALLLA